MFFFWPFVSTSLAYVTIPKNKRKRKIRGDRKLTTTYIFGVSWVILGQLLHLDVFEKVPITNLVKIL